MSKRKAVDDLPYRQHLYPTNPDYDGKYRRWANLQPERHLQLTDINPYVRAVDDAERRAASQPLDPDYAVSVAAAHDNLDDAKGRGLAQMKLYTNLERQIGPDPTRLVNAYSGYVDVNDGGRDPTPPVTMPVPNPAEITLGPGLVIPARFWDSGARSNPTFNGNNEPYNYGAHTIKKRKRTQPHGAFYCMHCRRSTVDVRNPTPARTRRGQPMIKAKCGMCGTRVNRFVPRR
jgi:hypothetical protein